MILFSPHIDHFYVDQKNRTTAGAGGVPLPAGERAKRPMDGLRRLQATEERSWFMALFILGKNYSFMYSKFPFFTGRQRRRCFAAGR
jgi:hypothetical protein